MDSEANTTSYDPHYESSTVGAQLAAAKAPSELERCFIALDKQSALIAMLDERLNPVLHRSQSESAKEQRDMGPHISTVGDLIQRNNQRLQQIINELAI